MINNRITTMDIVKNISANNGYDEQLVKDIVYAHYKEMKRNLYDGKKVLIRGFGSYELVMCQAHEGYDFVSGTVKKIPEYSKVKFTPSVTMKKREIPNWQ